MPGPKKILIVDDDERNTFALGSYLEAHGFEIILSKDGSDALDRLSSGLNPDLVLLDMMMPVMDGFETLAELKKSGMLTKLPVIAVTAKAMPGDEEKCLAAGAVDYLPKPVDLKQLLEKIQKFSPDGTDGQNKSFA